MPLPNFLVIGDKKAGSTSLYYYLSQHPDVFMPTALKELRYFSYDPDNPYQQTAKSTRVRSLGEYEAWFQDCGAAIAIGEASPNYLRSPVAAANIKRQLDDPKLIVCLRNPVDRLYSSYLMGRRSHSRNQTFEATAFSEDCAWIKGNFVWNDLKRYYDIFPRQRIKVVLFDKLVKSPGSVVSNLFEFLAVDHDFVPDFAIKNLGGIPRSPVTYSVLVKMKSFLKRTGTSNPVLRKTWAGIRDRSLYKPPLNPITRTKVLEVFRDDIVRTQDLIEMDLNAWLK